MTSQSLRFGYTGSSHLLPLLYPLEAGWVLPAGRPVTWHDLPPSELLAQLDAGTLDAALVSPVAYARRRRTLDLLPGVGLASEGANALAVLHSTERADSLDGQPIAVPAPPTDAAGAALLAVLLRPYFGMNARILPPNTPLPPGTPGGTLLLGDDALAARRAWLLYDAYLRTIEPPDAGEKPHRARPRPVPAPDPAGIGYVEDLGAAWWVLTGVPLVWLVGVVRQALLAQEPDLPTRLSAAFVAARRAATEQQPTLLAAAASRAGLPEPVLTALFATQIPALTPREYGALDAYYTYTQRLGLTPR